MSHEVAIGKPNENGNLFEIRTVQSAAFRTLIEALKDILTDANIEFDSTGMKILAVDDTHTVLTYLKLESSRFETFYCPSKQVLGINMINFFKLIKTISNNDHLTLFLQANNPNKLGIRADNAEKGTTNTWMMKLYDIRMETMEFPNITFTSVIHMPSLDFQKICRDFNQLAERLEITSSNADLIFRCMGDFVDGETVIMSNNQSGITVERNTNEIVQGVFEMKFLMTFTKCTSLCSSVQIHLKNDRPLVLRYMVANLGEIRLVLAGYKDNKETHARAQRV